jgi:ParB/RepB/Spo0J family partition protein
MNAPAAPAAVMTELVAEHLPITSIRPSPSAAQKLRRARYNAEQLLALAANIQQVGVMQPILVRPVDPDGTVKFEIVAGERRWLASDRAGLAHVPAIIRELTESDALKLQVCENIQRESTHPLEEAEAFHDIMRADKINAEQLGDIIGKSRSYVYARTKLRELCPEARDALQAGTLDASKALLLARMPGGKLQKQALKLVTENSYWSFRRLFEAIREKLMVDLDGAPFALDDDSYFYMQKVAGKRGEEECIAIPACLKCPNYSGNDSELRESLDDGADVCTDKPCFEGKVKMFWQRRRSAAESAGRTVIAGDDAKKIIRDQWGSMPGHVNIDAECEDVECPEEEPKETGNEAIDHAAWEAFEKRCENWRPPTIRSLLGDTAPPTVLVEDPYHHGKLLELAPKKDVAKALRKAGVKLESWRWKDDERATDDDAPSQSEEDRKAEREREQLQEKIELEYRTRLFLKVAEKWKGPLKRPDLERLHEIVADYRYGDEAIDRAIEAAFGGKEPDIAKMKDEELMRYIMLLTVVNDIQDYGKPGALLELAARFKIDAKKIRADVAAELKPKPAAKADAAAPAPKKAPAKAKKAVKK